MEDKKILELLWNRTEGAIAALAAKFGRRLHSTAMNILGDTRDAEEAVNDTYMALWSTIPPARPDPLCAYVYKVGRNTALTLLRKKNAGKRNSSYDLSLDELSQVLTGDTLEAQLDARTLGKAIDSFLGTLSVSDRTLFLRRYWFGDSVGQLAAQRFATPGAISTRLHRIREKLKNYLIKEGFYI